jgi:uncharacterized protein YbjT (DUF2867 family)
MSSYSSIALFGAGPALGDYFVKALAASTSISFIVVTRPESTSSERLPPGTSIVAADLTNLEQLTALFNDHKIDAVISTLGFAGRESQPIIASAAKAAGVRLFVLSDFGFPSLGATGVFEAPDRQAKYAESIGLPYVRIFVSSRLFGNREELLTDIYFIEWCISCMGSHIIRI